MRRSEIISRIFGLLVLALLLTWLAEDAHGQATDTYIGACASQQSCTLATNVSWATGNQVWRFTAYQPNESIRVWIWNHNPTNGHSSQTVQIWVTDDGTVPSLLNNADRWVQACVTDNSTTGAQLKNVSANNPTATPGANGKATGYTVGMYAVQIAVRITGAAAQAGNPDTFDIGIVQQPTTYPGGPQPGCDSSAGSGGNSSIANIPVSLNSTTSQSIGIMVEKGPRWEQFSCPGTSLQATTTIAAAASTRHVLDCVSFSAASIVAPAAAFMQVGCLDGVTTIWNQVTATTTSAGQAVAPFAVCGLNITGTTNTLMTCQFGVNVTNVQECIAMSGYDIK